MKKIALSLLVAFTISACETDEQKIEKCTDLFNTFLSNLPLDNYPLLNKIYPNFRNLGKYRVYENIKIVNSSVSDEGIVTIVGATNNQNLLFEFKKVDGDFKVINSKGLSADFNSYLYAYCKRIGCLTVDTYDIELSRICSEKRDEFNSLVYRIKNDIESNFRITSNNLKNFFGTLNGDITFKNFSRFTIPSRTYHIYYNFSNSYNSSTFTKERSYNYETIPYGQSLTDRIFGTGSFNRIEVELKITSTDFIERVIAENINGSNCIVSQNPF